MIEEGQPAPTFTLPSETGDEVSLDSVRGTPIHLTFSREDDRSPPGGVSEVTTATTSEVGS